MRVGKAKRRAMRWRRTGTKAEIAGLMAHSFDLVLAMVSNTQSQVQRVEALFCLDFLFTFLSMKKVKASPA